AKIIGQQADGAWLEKASIIHKTYLDSATFSADSRYVITVSNGGSYSVTITELRSHNSLLAVTE
ncbi:hypothetical protein, partial [Endozoicomonas sp. SESOKO4]